MTALRFGKRDARVAIRTSWIWTALPLFFLSSPQLEAEAPVRLRAGLSVERSLDGGEVHRYSLPLAEGEVVRLRADQRGIDVVLRLLRNGEVVRESDRPTGAREVEILGFLADKTGDWRLEVAGFDGPESGSYFLEVEALGPPTADDRRWLAADGVMRDGYRFSSSGQPGDNPRAIRAFQDAATAWRALGESAQEAEALYRLGVVFRRGGQPGESLAAHEQARELFEREGNRRGLVRTLNDIGFIHAEAGRHREARPHFEEALRLAREAHDTWRERRLLANLAVTLDRLGEPKEELLAETLAYAREAGDRDLEARINSNLGSLHRGQGELQVALDYFQEAGRLARELGPSPLQASILHNLGTLYRWLGESERSLELLNEALELYESTGNAARSAPTLTKIGEIIAASGDPDRARPVLERALVLRQKAQDRDGEAVTRRTLSMLHLELGDPERARQELETALEIQREIDDWRRIPTTLRQLGDLHAAGGDTAAAAAAYDQSLRLSRAHRSQANLFLGHAARARLEAGRDRLEEAGRYLELALADIESARRELLDPELRASFFGRRRGVYELYVDILMRQARQPGRRALAERALEISEHSRARGLVELLSEASSEIHRGVDPDLAGERRRLTRRLNAKSALLLRRGDAGTPEARWLEQEIDEAIDALRAVDVEIRRGYPDYLRLLEPGKVGFETIQASVPEGTLLLEYALGDTGSWVWAVTRSSLRSFELPPRGTIETAARRAHELLSVRNAERRRELCRTLARLGEMLLAPAAGELERRPLIVVPDGALHYLPFAALGDPRDGGAQEGDGNVCSQTPLLEHHEIVHASSAAARIELRARSGSPPTRDLALVADPVFQTRDPRVVSARTGTGAATRPRRSNPFASDVEAGFDRLPWSLREAERIAAIARDAGLETFQALGFAARRETLTGLADYRLVHLATHGLYDNRRPNLSGLVLSLVDEAGDFDDGFLRLHDVYNLELRADLVVLSGCRTALGREMRSEGLVGLSRGFFYAGAARVLASLWRIDDRATAELMERFYRALLHEKMKPAAALREAQRTLRRQVDWQDPYFWAAFILQGE